MTYTMYLPLFLPKQTSMAEAKYQRYQLSLECFPLSRRAG